MRRPGEGLSHAPCARGKGGGPSKERRRSELSLEHGMLTGGTQEVRCNHVSIAQIEDGRLQGHVEQLLRVPQKELVDGRVPRHVDRERLVIAAPCAPCLLPQR